MQPELLWSPAADAATSTRLGRFLHDVGERTGHSFETYEQAWQWSVEHLGEFWGEVWRHFDVICSEPYTAVLEGGPMPDIHWFSGARLNYAEQALRRRGPDPAIVSLSQTRQRVELSWDQLADQVARARAGLQRLGVATGDRVAAYLPNIAETVIALLACASIGATFTTCAPEFGVQAVLDRLAQVEPVVLLAVSGYQYGAKSIDRTAELAAIRAGLPTVRTTVAIDYGSNSIPDAMSWPDLLAAPGPLEFAQVPFDHPLYVLYSSGTTGLPKAIVHGHGGILLTHLKDVGLMSDIGPTDRFFWFSTTGWMMWNFLVSGLLVGATVVLFDGDPSWPNLGALWQLAAEEQITWFGVSAPLIMTWRKAGLRPGTDHDLSALLAIGSTGAPLPGEGFHWVYDEVSPTALLTSISGGTDVCTAYMGASPLTDVRAGEIACRFLGCAVEAFDEAGHSVTGKQGELVITQPLPSMPVGFWGDTDGSRYRAAYFDTYPGVWRHGDWITITDRGSCIITGRSDATLNRGGVRIGTAEIYRVVEAVPGIADSLIVHLEDSDGGAGQLVLLIALTASATETEAVAAVRTALRTDLSPRHVPDEVHVVASIPTTLSGKKLEVPVKKILGGADPDEVASRGALSDPASLDDVASLARRRMDRI